MSLKEKLANANNSEHAQKSSDWFKFKEGDNTIRVLTEPETFFEDYKLGICYTDCGFQGSVKGLSWVLDRADNKIKLMKLTYNFMQQLENYESDEDYSYEEYPMPYDVKINAKNAGSKEVKYSYIPRPRKELDPKIIEDLSKEKSCIDIIEKMKENNINKHKEDGTWDRIRQENAELKERLDKVRPVADEPDDEINPEDIPFEN